MNFDEAFDRLIGFEGDYSNDPRDPGGETRFGVTRRVAIQEGYTGDMHVLPREFAKRVYRKRYWDAIRADDLPPVLRYAVFDAGVNSGVKRVAEWLRVALDLGDEGGFDDLLVSTAAASDPSCVAATLCGIRLDFLTALPTWGAYGRGWARRIASILQTIKPPEFPNGPTA